MEHFNKDNQQLLVRFITRLSRSEISEESAAWVAQHALNMFLLEYEEEVRKFMRISLAAVLRSLPFDELLLNQDEYLDLKIFIKIARDELAFLGYRIS